MINILKNICNFSINSISSILTVAFILFLLPYSLKFFALFCNHRTYVTCHKISRILKRFNKHIYKGISRLIMKIYKKIYSSLYLLTKFKSIKNLFRKEDLKKSIMALNPEEFEQFYANIYRNLGYKATVTQFGNDGGKDIILADKEHSLTYVQCKRWNEKYGHEIGREICQKLIGICASDGVKKAIIATTGKIHENALEYQKNFNNSDSFNLEIVDFDTLIQVYIKAFGIDNRNPIY